MISFPCIFKNLFLFSFPSFLTICSDCRVFHFFCVQVLFKKGGFEVELFIFCHFQGKIDFDLCDNSNLEYLYDIIFQLAKVSPNGMTTV